MQRFVQHGLLALLLMLAPCLLWAQGAAMVTVSGVVTSAEDKQPLIGVTVLTETMSGVTTSIDGDYSIQVCLFSPW